MQRPGEITRSRRLPRSARGWRDPRGFVIRHGARLYLDGRPYRFTGVAAYELATWWAVNRGCGAQVNDLNGFFASLRPGSMVKISAFQALAVNVKTRAIDFRPLDRVVRAAERHGQKLIMSLSVQQGDCDDGHWKGSSWYSSGYRRAFNDDGAGLSRRSFVDWMRLIVRRYRKSPAIGMWQLVGEPEASDCAGATGRACYGRARCPAGAAAVLRRFFDVVGGELKRIDPRHLLGTGTLSRLQCGWSAGGYRRILQSPAIDVANYHDYGNDSTALPTDLRRAIADAAAAGKPFVMDESGIAAGGGDCRTIGSRRTLMRAKLVAGLAAGMSGFVTWNWEPRPSPGCSMAIAPNDPLLGVLRTVRL